MAWQPEVGASSNRATDYRDLLMKKVAFMTSQHVSIVVINNGGTGGAYLVGDIVTLTHAGAVLDARFEVLTVAGGQILTMKIDSSGAFSNRIATVAVNVGGTGYANGDILEIQGGTQRERGKASVTTQVAGVITVIALFETGGAYSVAPSLTAEATIGIGPSTYAGNDDATLDLTMTGLIGTTNLAVTGGGGTGATVDITKAETGWTVDGRNTNNRVETGTDPDLFDEKEVVLVGDATGLTNKPYIGMISTAEDVGINSRFAIVFFGMLAHNSSLPFRSQPGLSPGMNVTTGALEADGSYLLCDEDQVQEMDFWFSVDDRRILGEININPAAASTDDGEYTNYHVGLMNSYKTEVENPYPFFVFGPARVRNIDPSAASVNISCMPEMMSFTGVTASGYFFVAELSAWQYLKNSSNLSADTEFNQVMFPLGKITAINGSSDENKIAIEGFIESSNDWSSTARAAAAIKLLPVPGVTDLPFLWALNILYRPGGTSLNESFDTPRGELRGIFWLTATDDVGVKRVNFSEDIVTIGSDRYRVFHTHVHTNTYHYYAIKEDI